ncbi:Homedomain-like superfamily protein, partial [Pleurotus pulmonarius]
MGNYRFIHPEQKKLIITMSATMTPTQISKHTGISTRTIYRILEKWRHLRTVTLGSTAVGRPRELTHYDFDFIEGLVEQQPDIYLSEIRHALRSVLDLDVSLSTISRSLLRRGLSRKQLTRIGRERS